MPTWGLARGSGGNNSHFHRAAGAADAYYYFGSWDAAFTLIGTSAACASPVITQDPLPLTVCYLGADVSFTVAATTTVGTLSYQWRRNGNPVTDGPNGGGAGGGAVISGARTATLTIAQPSYYAQPGIYDCAVSSPCGVTNSAGAQLDVAFGPPAIASGPIPAAVCLGGTASFSVTPDNPALTYMWRKDWGEGLVDGPTASGSEIWGAATATMTIINIQPGDVATYGCSVINGCWANSDSAALTIVPCGCGLADIAGGGAAGQSPDGIVDGSDFIAFINSFSTGDSAVDPLADVAGGGPDGLSPDGIIDGSDFIAFINAFAAGC